MEDLTLDLDVSLVNDCVVSESQIHDLLVIVALQIYLLLLLLENLLLQSVDLFQLLLVLMNERVLEIFVLAVILRDENSSLFNVSLQLYSLDL